jgi:hypothetical protein
MAELNLDALCDLLDDDDEEVVNDDRSASEAQVNFDFVVDFVTLFKFRYCLRKMSQTQIIGGPHSKEKMWGPFCNCPRCLKNCPLQKCE